MRGGSWFSFSNQRLAASNRNFDDTTDGFSNFGFAWQRSLSQVRCCCSSQERSVSAACVDGCKDHTLEPIPIPSIALGSMDRPVHHAYLYGRGIATVLG